MTTRHPITALRAAALPALVVSCTLAPSTAHGASAAEGPATPQAVAAHAEFLATLPPPPGGAGAVCVIDSGVDTTTDLGPALIARSAYDGGTLDDTGAKGDDGTQLTKHGTYVAGVIASQIDGIGTNGIWPAAKILSRRVFTGPGSAASASAYINAVQWCVRDLAQDNVKVINLSLSGLRATLEEQERLEDKIEQVRLPPYNIDVVAAAGNNGLSYLGYPASETGVFAVGAIDENSALAPFSNHGTGLDVSTFGTATCITTASGSRLGVARGTSFAAPVVSAVLDALRSYQPSLTPDQAEQLLLDTADIALAGKTLNAARAFAAVGIITSADDPASYPSRPCTPGPTVTNNVAPSDLGLTTNSTGVESEAPTSPPSSSTSVGASQPAFAAPLIDVRLPVAASGALKPNAPIVRSASEHNGLLIVRISGRRAGETVIFRVTQKFRVRRGWRTTIKTYRRGGSTLRVRTMHWTVVRIQLRRPGVGRSRVVTVTVNRDLY